METHGGRITQKDMTKFPALKNQHNIIKEKKFLDTLREIPIIMIQRWIQDVIHHPHMFQRRLELCLKAQEKQSIFLLLKILIWKPRKAMPRHILKKRD